MSNYLNLAEASEIKGCSERHIRRLIANCKLEAITDDTGKYIIPVSSLPENLQRKYYRKLSACGERERGKPPRPLCTYSDAEREQIALWNKIIKQWRLFHDMSDDKKGLDEMFVDNIKRQHPELEISLTTLYRKYKAYKEKNYDELIEKRGGWNKGRIKTPQHIIDAFLWFYLNDRQPTVSQCYRAVHEWTQKFHPGDISIIPSERSLRRQALALPEAIITLCRKGEKALKDQHCPYTERLYDDLEANDVWVGDNHTFDFITEGEHGKRHRLYLTAFIDVKSGVIVGFNITENPSSYSTLLALRDGILKYGLPKIIYVDNGSEFTTHDIGGRGHRRRKNWNKDDQPPTILEMLGIEVRFAQVCNAKAKPIERTFGTLKNQISRQFKSFCGGNVTERPESLKATLKRGEIPTDAEIRQVISTLINGSFNMDAYGGKERRYHGMSRIEVWNASIKNTQFRKAAAEDLSLLLARVSRYQKIGRKGVYATFSGVNLWYTRDELWQHQGTEVYVRYDPADATSVRVYSRDGNKYMFDCYLDSATMIDYIAKNPEDIEEAERVKSLVLKQIKDYKKGLTDGLTSEQKIDMLALECERAVRNLENYNVKHPDKFTPVMSDKVKREMPIVAEITEIDWTAINKNAKIRLGKD
ncbi:MAG: Mu transposase C-terminal domain-containing protein [Oscillospiraceae bacterium]|nr:Mu transposase C-terminal domain-containing protein [Oscillospiraceae bacterium]